MRATPSYPSAPSSPGRCRTFPHPMTVKANIGYCQQPHHAQPEGRDASGHKGLGWGPLFYEELLTKCDVQEQKERGCSPQHSRYTKKTSPWDFSATPSQKLFLVFQAAESKVSEPEPGPACIKRQSGTLPLKQKIALCANVGNGKSARSFSDRSFFSRTSARDVRSEMLVFPGFGGPDRSFWPDVRRDIRPKTSSLGWIFVPENGHFTNNILWVESPGKTRRRELLV